MLGDGMNWPEPEYRDGDLATYWDRLLWNRYRKAAWERAEGVHPGWNQEWMTLIKDFRAKLVTCDAIQTVIGVHCRSYYHAHTLLVILFFVSDQFERNRAPGAFGGLQPFHDPSKNLAKSRRKARADLRQFDKMKGAIDRLSDLYSDTDRAGMRVMVDEGQRRSTPHLNQPFLKVIELSLHGESIPLTLTSTRVPKKATRGRPPFDGAQMNTYLAVVRALVAKAYRGCDRDELTLDIVKAFSPTLLDAEYDTNMLFSRLEAFTEKPGVRAYLKREQDMFEKAAIMRIFPYPDFAHTPPTSSIVTDRVR